MSWVSLDVEDVEALEEDEWEELDVWDDLGFLLTDAWLVDAERPFCPAVPDVDFDEVELLEVSFEAFCTSLGFSVVVEAVSLDAAEVEGLGSAIWLIIFPTTSWSSESKMAASLVSAWKNDNKNP